MLFCILVIVICVPTLALVILRDERQKRANPKTLHADYQKIWDLQQELFPDLVKDGIIERPKELDGTRFYTTGNPFRVPSGDAIVPWRKSVPLATGEYDRRVAAWNKQIIKASSYNILVGQCNQCDKMFKVTRQQYNISGSLCPECWAEAPKNLSWGFDTT